MMCVLIDQLNRLNLKLKISQENDMVPSLILLLVAVVLIAKGGSWFIDSVVAIAEATHIPKVIIGATIVSVATSGPEIAVSFIASYLGSTEMALGNIVGSVNCNIGIAFGLIVVFSVMPVARKVFMEQGFLMIISGAVLLALGMFSTISRTGGVMLLVMFAGYAIYSIKRARQKRAAEVEQFLRGLKEVEKIPADTEKISLKKEIIFFIMGAVLIGVGSRLLVYSGTNIARDIGISEGVIGLTIMALGTSIPELTTSIVSALKGHQEITFSNIIGSNVIDITLAVGGSAVIRPLTVQPGARFLDLPVMLLLIVLMVFFGRTKDTFHRWEGAILLVVYVVYIALLFVLPSGLR